jgi:hypothetical protein
VELAESQSILTQLADDLAHMRERLEFVHTQGAAFVERLNQSESSRRNGIEGLPQGAENADNGIR